MIKTYLQLGRIEFAGFLACVMLSGALCIKGVGLHVLETWPIFIVAVLTNIWGFAHNDWQDVHIDRMSPKLSDRPLVSGQASKRGTLILIGVSVSGVILVNTISAPGLAAFLIILSSIVLGCAYNILSKRIPGMDFVFAASTAMLCLVGAMQVDGYLFARNSPNSLLWAICMIYFLDHAIFNIGATLKDVRNDQAFGANTISIALGVQIKPQRQLCIPKPFKYLVMILKATSLLVFIFFAWTNGPPFGLAYRLLIPAMAATSLFLTFDALRIKTFDRKEIGLRWIKQEAFCKLLPPLLMLPVIGLAWFLFLIFFPFIWFALSLRLIHGNSLKLYKGF